MYTFNAIAAGFLVSLIGSLPLGSLNVTAMHIAAQEGLRKSFLFALGVVLTEVIYLRITLAGVDRVMAHRSLFLVLQWLTVALLLALAIGSFRAAYRQSGGKNVLIQNNVPRFFLGSAMSALNPMQFPFWAGWALLLISRHTLQPCNAAYNIFTVSAGFGTLAALLVFIFFGRRLSGRMLANQKKVQLIMGMLFSLLFVYQLVIMYRG